ncbi:MAG: DUF1998 domain-containing protein, partial [Planctomycetales bacterium]|nr:DUF1998 domain-containing protein [Planctomycetales bacterium]
LRHMSDNTFSIVLVRDADFPSPTRPLVHAGRANTRSVEQLAKMRSSALRTPGGEKLSGSVGRARRTDTDDVFEVIANVDAISAPELVYPEAVYLHNGETYFVRQLDLDGKVAYVERRETDYYTQAVLESDVRIVREQVSRPWTGTGGGAAGSSGGTAGLPSSEEWGVGNAECGVQDALHSAMELSSRGVPVAQLCYGEVDVTWQTVMFKKIKFETRENVGYGPVDIPAQSLPTTALWLTPDDAVRAQLKTEKLRTGEALCGLRNLAVVALPMVAMCDSRDISGVVDSKNLGKSTMIVYDRYPGGLGYSEKGYYQMGELLALCRDLVVQCPCDDGCPSCVGLPNLRPAIHSDPDLTRGYPMPSKAAARRLLELLV